MNVDLTKYDISMATHWLDCSHGTCYNNIRHYTMHCLPLGKTKSGKMKLVVFGERDWKFEYRPKIKIRYVEPGRVNPKRTQAAGEVG